MKAVTVRFRTRSRLLPTLVLLIALAAALLPARPLLAAPDATASQSAATPTPTAAGHAGMSEAPARAADTSHEAMPAAAKDDHALPAPAASAGHADEPAHESLAAHGDEAEAPAAATRSLVLGGFGAVNGLVVVGAAILKTRSGKKAKARRVSPPDPTPKGAAQ